MATVKSINPGAKPGKTPAQPPWTITTMEGFDINLHSLKQLAEFAREKAHQAEALMSCITDVRDLQNAEAALPLVYDLVYQTSFASEFLASAIDTAGKEVAHV
ncbi:MAG TPA: hypothetical protein VN617_11790 [Rhodoferax sp.]|nr:hypothetical protein [Rhodoferax sp.]